MEQITIITPCSRPDNLFYLYNSINFMCKWIIVFDGIKIIDFPFLKKSWIVLDFIPGGVSGNLQRNKALEKIKDGWIYVLDDDNLMHLNFYKTFYLLTKNNKSKEAIIFSQIINNSGAIRESSPNNIGVTLIDQAQFVVKKSLVKDLQYTQKYEADGIFITELYNKNKETFLFCNKPVTYYNKLKHE